MGKRSRHKGWFGLQRWQALLGAVIAATASIVIAVITASGGSHGGLGAGVPQVSSSSEGGTSAGGTPQTSTPQTSTPQTGISPGSTSSTRPTSPATTAQGGAFPPAQILKGPDVNVASQQEEKASVSCPSGTRVTGGGGSSPGVVYLTDSYMAADNGWTVWAYNPGPATRALHAWAMCSSAVPAGANSENIGTPITIDPGANRSTSVTCPPGKVAIGGGGSGQGIAYLTSSYPDASDKWVASATNPLKLNQVELKARVLCGPEPRSYPPLPGGPVSLAHTQEKSASVTCSSGVPISGGGYISGGPGTYLTDSYPNAKGWTVWAVNTGSTPSSLTAVVLCARP